MLNIGRLTLSTSKNVRWKSVSFFLLTVQLLIWVWNQGTLGPGLPRPRQLKRGRYIEKPSAHHLVVYIATVGCMDKVYD